jgi:hypothetical protein
MLFLPGFDPWTLQPVVDLLVGFLVLVSFEIDSILVGKQVSGSFFVREEGKVNITCSFLTKSR